MPSRTTKASIWTSTSTSTCRRHATPDSCRCGSSGRRRVRTIPSGPPASCIAGSRRTRTSNVRGVRNIPCETKPGKRAPTVEMCESDEQYVPLNDGYNWKGDPNATLSGQGVPQYAPGRIRGCHRRRALAPHAATGAPRRPRHPSPPFPTTRPPATTSARTESATRRPTWRTRRGTRLAVDAGAAAPTP